MSQSNDEQRIFKTQFTPKEQARMANDALCYVLEQGKKQISMELEIKNAQITSVSLGYSEHGIFTSEIWLKASDGKTYMFGGYALDDYDKESKKRVATAVGFQSIIKTMDVVGVSKWEELCGKFVRIAVNPESSFVFVSRIGNLMEDRWFDIEDFFSKRTSKAGG